MARFGLIGPSYTSQSPNVDNQVCINWYVENIESGAGKSAAALYPTPGLILFCDLQTGVPVRGKFEINGRVFAVSGINLFEIFADGTTANLGAMDDDGQPVTFAANNANQLLLVAAKKAYLLNLNTGALTTPNTQLGAVTCCAFTDGYFILLLANSFQISALEDGSSWDALDVFQVSSFSDNLVGMLVDHRELWLWGRKKSTAYYNSGNPDTPFEPIPGAAIEQGLAAAFGRDALDNSIFWWGQDARGGRMAWRAQGYTPARISNHGVEFAVQKYATISDAVSFSYQDQGHLFWVTYFPAADKTWVYDVSTGMWHERGYWNNGVFSAHRMRSHVYAFEKHLVGDRLSGKIYEMSINFYDDNGEAIRRVRRSPHISSEQQRLFHSRIQIDVETGLGPQPPLLDGAGNARDPQMMLRWFDDGGHVSSNGYVLSCGKAGEFKKRAIMRRLGLSRDRVYEISVSDPIAWRIIEGYVEAEPGFAPQERLAAQYRKIT